MANTSQALPCSAVKLLGSAGAAAVAAGDWFYLPDGVKSFALHFRMNSALDADITIKIEIACDTAGPSKASPITETTKVGSGGSVMYEFDSAIVAIRANVTAYLAGGLGSNVIMAAGLK